MAAFRHLCLCFASLQGLAHPEPQSDCQDDSSILQFHSGHDAKALTCPHGEEEFTFADWNDGLYTTGNSPVPGVTISGFTVGPDDCKQPAIVSPATRIRSSNPGISQCDCSALMMADTASPDDRGRLGRCRPSKGAPTVELTFDTPRDIVSVSFLNVNYFIEPRYITTFTYRIPDPDGRNWNSHTVTIPNSAGVPRSSTVDISTQCLLPSSVEKVSIQFGNNAAFTGMTLCKTEASLMGHPPVRIPDHALFQTRFREASKRLTCPHGEEEYALTDWNEGFYTTGDSPVSGITISGFTVGPDDCHQPAIMTTANAKDPSEMRRCACSALIMADESDEAGENGNTVVNRCQPSAGAPRIELTFDTPQDIVSVNFVTTPTSSPDYATTFTYEVEEVGGDPRASHTVRIPSFEAVDSVFTTVDLSGECLLPQNVVRVIVQFGQLAAFTGMKLCKGAASLVGDPHVRTQDHTHYTVLNAGNFLAWRFNSHSAFTGKSGPKKVEVDWRIYAHYSAHRRSWTRGLLLVDQSMGSYRQSFELTSEECKLRKRMGGEWKVMESSELLQVSEAGDFVTGFNFTHLENGTIHVNSKKIWAPKGKKARWDAQFSMATPRGKQLVATVQLRCFPGRHIDVQVIRERMGDARFVQGQLGHHGVQLKREKNGLGHWFHTSSDHEFQLNTSWAELGGSREAAAFFELEKDEAKASLTGNPTCSPEEKQEAMKLCQETMKLSRNADAEFLDECVIDICAGGGVASAELAGDIFSS